MKLYKIKKSDIDKKGRGLYATKDIKAGTKVIDYIGKLIIWRCLVGASVDHKSSCIAHDVEHDFSRTIAVLNPQHQIKTGEKRMGLQL